MIITNVMIFIDIVVDTIYYKQLKKIDDRERTFNILKFGKLHNDIALQETKNMIEKYEAYISVKEDCECSQKKD